MMTAFALGTIWFWILVLLFSGLIIFALEKEDDNYIASIFFGIGLLILFFFGNRDFFASLGKSIIENPSTSILIFVAYLAIGTIWSFVKWFLFLKEQKDHYSSVTYFHFDIDRFKIAKNKERVLHWMIYWPFSLAWTMINNPVKRSFEFIISQFGGAYDKMTERILGDLIKKKENR